MYHAALEMQSIVPGGFFIYPRSAMPSYAMALDSLV